MYEFEVREREDEDAAAAGYERLYHGFPIARYWDDDFLAFLRPLVAEGDRVLDLGCGPGSMWPLWRRLPKLERLAGVDISPRMIEEAKAAHPDGEFTVGRAHELPYETGSFDVVIASSVLHHIPDEHLGEAFKEIVRVLDEHGRIVGREPTTSDFAAAPGWFSGSIMLFRHLVFRLTRSREHPEPTLGDHHHVFDKESFCAALNAHATVTQVEDRFPISSLLMRVRDIRVAEVLRRLDTRLADRGGSMFYFVAERNFARPDDVIKAIEQARRDELPPLTDAELLAYLEVAAAEIGEIFGETATSGPWSARTRQE
jgi:ubiquinone/menaquinone biosynthesis C-methylase UbiE